MEKYTYPWLETLNINIIKMKILPKSNYNVIGFQF